MRQPRERLLHHVAIRRCLTLCASQLAKIVEKANTRLPIPNIRIRLGMRALRDASVGKLFGVPTLNLGPLSLRGPRI